jgi:undecaprenyl-diphosphatase
MRADDQVNVPPGTGQRRRWVLPRGTPAAPLISSGARKPAAVLSVGCLLLVIALGIPSAHQSHGFAVDQAVDSWVTSLHALTPVMSALSLLGGSTEMIALTAVLALACLAARRVAGAVLAVVGVLVAATLTELVLKPLVHRTIVGDLTYPSGHTTGLFALATAIAVVVLGSGSGKPWRAARVAAVIAAVVVACAVGFAVIGLHYHYFTDTIGGAAVGAGTVLGVAFLLDAGLVRSWLGRLGR